MPKIKTVGDLKLYLAALPDFLEVVASPAAENSTAVEFVAFDRFKKLYSRGGVLVPEYSAEWLHKHE